MTLRVSWLAVCAFAISTVAFGEDAADARAVEAAAQAWLEAFNALDAEGMLAQTTDDIVLMDATMPRSSGRQAARATWQRSFPDTGIRITGTTKELEVAGDFAWRIGAFANERANGQVVSRGQALEIWKRVDGDWKLHRQMSSGLLARQPVLRRPLPTEPVLDDAGEKN